MPTLNKNQRREVTAILMTSAVILGLYALIQNPMIQDIWKGWQYQEDSAVGEIRKSLELTGAGERIFLATQPAIEAATEFNDHCDSHQTEVSLLGCYTGDKIYIYDVQAEDLRDSNKVTAAHELLHAVWSRLGKGEREKVTDLLQDVRRENHDWVQEELALYEDKEQSEELYTRVGTKLREIPTELEQHYAQYFTNRLKIVDYYESYQAPFKALRDRNAEIQEEVTQLSTEITNGRRSYTVRLEKLDQQIKSFNECADQAGCFSSKESFVVQRERLEAEKVALETMREELNRKIDHNNDLVAEYQKNQAALGELNNAMNSNIEQQIRE